MTTVRLAVALVFALLYAAVIVTGMIRGDWGGVYAVSPVGILVVTWLIGAEAVSQIRRTKRINGSSDTNGTSRKD